MQDCVTVHVDAPPGQVWSMMSDITDRGRFGQGVPTYSTRCIVEAGGEL